MFDHIVMRNSLDGATLTAGELAEAMLFYGKLKLILTPAQLIQLMKGVDIKLLKPIFDTWFLNSAIWESAKTSRWSLIDNELINTQAKKFCSALIYTEKKLQNDSILFGKNNESNLLLQVKAKNSLNRVFKTVHQNKAMSFEKPLKYPCSEEIADLLVKMGSKGIGHFMHSRQITCIESEMPIWKTILNDLPKSLLKKHSKCLKLYKNSFESIEKTRIRWCYGHEYVHPPYDMSKS